MIEQIYGLMNGEESEDMYVVMAEMINKLHSNIEAEERSEDEAWFQGLSQRYNTKEEVMTTGAQGRIRKYFAAAKEYFDKVLIDPLHVRGNAANLEDKTKEIFASVKKSYCSVLQIGCIPADVQGIYRTDW